MRISDQDDSLPYARLGFLIPHGDIVTEPTLSECLPKRISFHIARMMRLGKLTIQSLKEMTNNEMIQAALRLPIHELDLIVFHCTSASIAFQPGHLETRIQKRTNIPTITTAGAVVEALNFLEVSRILLASPYIDPIVQREIQFLRYYDIDVLSTAGTPMEDGQYIQNLSGADIRSWIHGADLDEVEGIFISCTGLRSLQIVEGLEEDLGLPILTSTGATIWASLYRLGSRADMPGYGRLLESVKSA